MVEDMDQVQLIPGGGLLSGSQRDGLRLTEAGPGDPTTHGGKLSTKPTASRRGAIDSAGTGLTPSESEE